MVILHGYDDDAGEENDIRPAERSKSHLLGGQCGRGHQKDTDPNPEKPDQTDIIGGFSLDDSQDERDVKEGKDRPCPRADLIKNVHRINAPEQDFLRIFFAGKMRFP